MSTASYPASNGSPFGFPAQTKASAQNDARARAKLGYSPPKLPAHFNGAAAQKSKKQNIASKQQAWGEEEHIDNSEHDNSLKTVSDQGAEEEILLPQKQKHQQYHQQQAQDPQQDEQDSQEPQHKGPQQQEKNPQQQKHQPMYDPTAKPKRMRVKKGEFQILPEEETLVHDVRKWGGMHLQMAGIFGEKCHIVKMDNGPTRLLPIERGHEPVDWFNNVLPPDITNIELKTRYKAWVSHLLDSSDSDTDPDTYMKMRAFFGGDNLTDDKDITDNIHEDFTDAGNALASLAYEMQRRGLAKEHCLEVTARETWKGLKMLRDVLCKAYNIHIALAQIRCAGDPKKLASLPVPESAFSEKLESKGYDDFHKIFLFLLKQFQNKNYRRTGGDVYVQQLNSKKQFTHCWKRESSIREAIYKCITPRYAFPQAWRCAFKGGGRNITNAAQQLQECEEPEFRKITKDRKALAWDDGIYLMAEDQYRDHLSPDIPASLNCGKFFAQKFDNDVYLAQMDGTEDWRKIQTPAAETVMDSQAFEPAVKAWMYALNGRMAHDVNETDSWQVQKFLKGVAGSGKSTLSRNQEMMYDACDLGILSNTVEKNFPLEALVDCFMYLALDIGSDFTLDQTLWQSMVSGEEVAINRKNKLRITVIWVHPGMLAGNNMPPWRDNSHSVSRRMVHFAFEKCVTGTNPFLPELMRKQYPAWIKKISMAYNDLGFRLRYFPVRPCLPLYFKKTEKKIKVGSHPLESFLESPSVMHGEGLYVPLQQFQDAFFKFCRVHNYQLPRGMDEDYYNAIFQTRQIVIEDDTRAYNGDEYSGKFVTMVDLQEQAPANNAYQQGGGGQGVAGRQGHFSGRGGPAQQKTPVANPNNSGNVGRSSMARDQATY